MADKRKGVQNLSPRTGRPTDNPKPDRITVRLDEESKAILTAYCEQQKTDKAEAIRRGIKRLKQEIKK
jgi:hypothetical protein